MEESYTSISDNQEAIDDCPVPGKIRLLDQITASNLRKSQVINRVSDIVRELVENGIDADAKRIFVSLVKSGSDKIEVRDDGHGIAPEDVPCIFQGGHTSKLNDTSNLTRGKYFGFRGEALNSICALGKVKLITKTASENVGRLYQFDFLGSVISEKKVAHNGGTIITVERLFEGIPVRRQRLTQKPVAKKELVDIEAFLKGVAFANPKCHISFYHDANMVWSKASSQTTEQSIITVLGHAMAKKMSKYGPIQVQIETEVSELSSRSIELHLPKKPVDMRAMSYTSNNLTMIFVNRKRVYIREFEKLIHRYITAVVEKSLPSDQRRFPVSLLFIDIPAEDVDFNRETDKTKVFLVYKNEIHETIEKALMNFYEIDLKNVDKNVPDTTEGNNIPDETNQEPKVVSKERGTETISKNLSSPNRQGTIATFLQDMPSATEAFINSPTKNGESTTVSFPTTKLPERDLFPKTSTNDPGSKPLEEESSMVVSNFQIFLDSQSQEVLEEPMIIITNHSTFSEKTPQPQQNEIKDKGDSVKSSASEKFQNWIKGRIKDKNGDYVENVIIGNCPNSRESLKDIESTKLRSVIAGPPIITSGQIGANCFADRRSTPSTPSPLSSFLGEPPQKKTKLDSPLLSTSHRLSSSTPNTPGHRQVTLDALSKWPSPSSVFSQRGSNTAAGVRIPLTPRPANYERPTSTFFSAPTPRPTTATVFQHQQPQPRRKTGSLLLDWPAVTRFIDKELPKLKWAPKVNGEIHLHGKYSTLGQLYSAQTHDKIGVFSPHNMVKHFPYDDPRALSCKSPGSRSSGYSSSSSGGNNLDKELVHFSDDEVSTLFAKFISHSDIFKSPFSDEIFYVIRELPSVCDVYRSMQNLRIPQH